MNIRRWPALLAVLIYLWVVSCTHPLLSDQTLSPFAGETKSITAQPLQMGCSDDWPGWWPWVIAEKQQFWSDDPQIELQWFDDYYRSLEALADGSLDANCQVFNDTVEVGPRSVNGEIIVLATDYSNGNDKVIVTEEVTNLAELKGQRIGVEAGKLTDFLLTLTLEAAGLSRDDLQIKHLNTADAVAAFSTGQLDAVVAWQPDWRQALNRPGSRELLSSRDFPGAIPQVIAVSQTALDQKGDLVQFLIQSWFRSLRFLDQHPDIARTMMLNCSQLSESEFELFWSGMYLLSLEENIQAFTPGDSFDHLSFTALKATRFLTEVGQLPRPLRLSPLLDDRPLHIYQQE